jgi:small subunit ribosomal protein S1
MKNSEQFSETPVEEVTPEVVPTDTIQEAAEPTTAAPVEEEAQQDVHPMEQLLQDSNYDLRQLEVGEIIEGTIVGFTDNNEVLVDISAKSEGVIPARDLDRVDDDIREGLKEGDSIFVQVVRPTSREGNAVLSLSRALAEYDWQKAEELLKSQEVFEGEVSGYNRGGVIVFLGKARGFVPASQLVSDEGKKQEDTDDRFKDLVGKKLMLKVIEMDRSRNRLILSERQAMREFRRQQKEKLLSELQVGSVHTGVVSSLAPFGAFVDLGGADGLIHLTELSWRRVQDPTEVVSIGEEVEVKVISVDRERRRIGLSLRQLQPEPWTVIHENYAIGQIVDGVITRLTSFGAFARIDDTIEGLIHISELSDHRIAHPKEVVKEGQRVRLRIIKIEPEKRRMGLSLKRVAEEEYAEVDWAPAEDDEVGASIADAVAEKAEEAAVAEAIASEAEVAAAEAEALAQAAELAAEEAKVEAEEAAMEAVLADTELEEVEEELAEEIVEEAVEEAVAEAETEEAEA